MPNLFKSNCILKGYYSQQYHALQIYQQNSQNILYTFTQLNLLNQ